MLSFSLSNGSGKSRPEGYESESYQHPDTVQTGFAKSNIESRQVLWNHLNKFEQQSQRHKDINNHCECVCVDVGPYILIRCMTVYIKNSGNVHISMKVYMKTHPQPRNYG